MNARRVLLVDDEENVLSALQRQLRGKFDIVTAQNAGGALRALETEGPFAVVVSDMRMPGKDGVDLLKEIKRRFPSTTRAMLTGNAEMETAVRAVQEGAVFRFLSKPCSADGLATMLQEAIAYHEQKELERDLLESTLRGAVQLLADVVALRTPRLGEVSTLASKAAGAMARKLLHEQPWQVEVAALLVHLGAATLLDGEERCEDLSLSDSTAISARLIRSTPRLDSVARILREVGGEVGAATQPGERLAAQLVALAHHVARAESEGAQRADALSAALAAQSEVDEAVEAELRAAFPVDEPELGEYAVDLSAVRPGMRLARPIVSENGEEILQARCTITPVLLERLRRRAELRGDLGPIWLSGFDRSGQASTTLRMSA